MSMSELFSLKGKTIVVTGGTGYLGQAICEGLVEAGAFVYIASLNEQKCINLAGMLAEKYNGNCRGLHLDIKDHHLIEKSFKEVVEYNGKIDVLINNASFSANGELEHVSEEDWLGGLDGTINGVFRCTRSVLPLMKKQREGNIINVSSMYVFVSTDPQIFFFV